MSFAQYNYRQSPPLSIEHGYLTGLLVSANISTQVPPSIEPFKDSQFPYWDSRHSLYSRLANWTSTLGDQPTPRYMSRCMRW